MRIVQLFGRVRQDPCSGEFGVGMSGGTRFRRGGGSWGRAMGLNGFLLSAALSIGVGAGMAWYLERPALERRDTAGESRPAETVEVGGPFTLVDQTGHEVTDRDFLGRYMLIYFGYSYCPDVCPTELQIMSEALDRLGTAAQKVQPVFVTVDPDRDTVETLAGYVKHFRPDLVGLTGSNEQIARVTSAYRVYAARDLSSGDPANYVVNHSSVTYLMDPKGKFLMVFPYGTKPEDMASGIRTHL